jgi:hypothetical protein
MLVFGKAHDASLAHPIHNFLPQSLANLGIDHLWGYQLKANLL